MIFVLALSSSAKNDLQKAQLKGKVRCITYFETFVGDSLEKQTILQIYNRLGNELTTVYYRDEVVSDSNNCKYDEQGKRTEEKSKSWRTVYMYGTDDKPVESRRYVVEDGSLMERVIFWYDCNGNDSEVISYGGSGRMNYRMVIQVAANGDRVETMFDTSGKVEQKYEQQYDTDNSLRLQSSYTNFGGYELKRTTKYYYYGFDKRGNWTLRKCSVSGEKVEYEILEKRVIEYYQ